MPGYDANDSGEVATNHVDLLLDPIISQFYEPGSVMKMLTAASALENEVVTPSHPRSSTVAASVSGPSMVRNCGPQGHGQDPVPGRHGVLPQRGRVEGRRPPGTDDHARRDRRSTRPGTSWASGSATGIDLAGEVAGIAPDPRHSPWAPIDLANRSFGQGVATTPIQLATAFTPMINGGLRVQPHFLVAIDDRKQEVAPPDRVLTKKVSRQLKGIMEHVTGGVSWYAEGSLIPRYTWAARPARRRSGATAQGRYDRDTYNFSFVGFVGGDEPAAVVALRIDEADPRVPRPGDLDLSIKSFELFRRVALGIISTQEMRKSSDPSAGRPEPGSGAERVLEPVRYARRMHGRAGSR